MTKQIQPTIYEDFLSTAHSESFIQASLRKKTVETIAHHRMMTTPQQVQFLAFLVRRIAARSALEIGAFTGYGSLAIAKALPADGRLVTCDIHDEQPSIGNPFWEAAGVANKIDLRIAPALETLQHFLEKDKHFDFIFVDADKRHYLDYFELSLKLLHPEGLMVIDNMLWVAGRKVVDQDTPAARGIKALLARVETDDRVDSLMVPLDSGMLLIQKA